MAAPRLLAAIGDTQARFGLLYPQGRLERIRAYPCAEHENVVAAIEAYFADVGGERPTEAAIAASGPIADDQVTLANGPWSFSLERSMQQLRFTALHACNDLVAAALAAPRLPASELKKLGGGSPVPNTPTVVLGPGAGLGIAALVPTGAGAIVPVPGEGGHASFSPITAREMQVAGLLAERFGHASVERVVSESGLVNVYEALCQLDRSNAQARTPAEVLNAALMGSDRQSVEALDIVCAALGTAAGNAVLTLGARAGIYLTGDMFARMGAYFDNSPFRQRFDAKGRYSGYLSAVPCYVILNEYPALIGVSSFFAGR